jgi:hypothetical protein
MITELECKGMRRKAPAAWNKGLMGIFGPNTKRRSGNRKKNTPEFYTLYSPPSIGGSHSDGYEEYCILECDVVVPGLSSPTFRRSILPRYLGSKFLLPVFLLLFFLRFTIKVELKFYQTTRVDIF